MPLDQPNSIVEDRGAGANLENLEIKMKLLNKATIQGAAILSMVMFMSGNAYAADHAVKIESFAFSPSNISVAIGDTITFTNMDSAPHTASANDGSFDTGTLSKGKSKTVTISAAGTHAYKCNFHPSMTGNVTAN